MAQLTDYKGILVVTPSPLPGDAGQAINENFKTLADQITTEATQRQTADGANATTLTTHTSNVSNPHSTTAAQMGAISDAAKQLQITYTGSWQYPYIFDTNTQAIIAMGNHATILQDTYAAQNLVGVSQFVYSENGISAYPLGLRTLSFDNLAFTGGSFSPSNISLLTSCSLPVLRYIGGNCNPAYSGLLTTLSLPVLQYINGNFMPNNMNLLPTLSFPALQYIGGTFNPSSIGVTTLSFPTLQAVGGHFIPEYMGLPTLSFPALQYIGGYFRPGYNGNLTTLSFPALQYVGSSISTTITANLANVTIGTVGVTKFIGGNYTLTAVKLTQVSVDGILAVISSLDGTNGTTAYGTGKTVNLSGGTSATPSAAGLVSKATIVARGATVTTN